MIALVVDSQPVSDTMHPGGEGGLGRVEALNIVDGPQQGVLCQFLCVLLIAHDADHKLEDTRRVLPQELFLGSGLSSTEVLYYTALTCSGLYGVSVG